MSPTPTSRSGGSSARMSNAETNTASGESPTASIANGSLGNADERPQTTDMYAFTTARFLSDEAQPYVPAGIFDLHANARSFLDATHRPAEMARHLKALLRPLPRSGGTTTGDGDNHAALVSFYHQRPPVDEDVPVEGNDDSDSLLSLSDDEEPANGPSTS